MLFGYPISAIAENWLHDCLVEMVTTIHKRLDQGLPPLKWPDCIPQQHRTVLKSRRGLRDHLSTYRKAAKKLTPKKRALVLTCLSEQNKISDLVSGKSDCKRITALPKDIRDPIKTLFNFAFGLLTDLGIRDRNYQAIYDGNEHHVCPFCGCEPFDAPGSGTKAHKEARHIREDLDHYLPKESYPFAAANLHNLSPMGGRCNSFKGTQDVLRGDRGGRRRAFYPYGNHRVTISLINSIPFKGTGGQKPDWKIEFQPDTPECATWDQVFSLRSRLKQNVLDPCFGTWLREFSFWFKAEYPNVVIDRTSIVAALNRYASNEAIKGLNGRDFLRTLVFQMMHRHCSGRHARLLALIKDSIELAVPPRV